MEPLAILITAMNCDDYAEELKNAYPHPNGYMPSYWIGYYLTITEDGPEILTPAAFYGEWEFLPPTKLQPIKPKL